VIDRKCLKWMSTFRLKPSLHVHSCPLLIYPIPSMWTSFMDNNGHWLNIVSKHVHLACLYSCDWQHGSLYMNSMQILGFYFPSWQHQSGFMYSHCGADVQFISGSMHWDNSRLSFAHFALTLALKFCSHPWLCSNFCSAWSGHY